MLLSLLKQQVSSSYCRYPYWHTSAM